MLILEMVADVVQLKYSLNQVVAEEVAPYLETVDEEERKIMTMDMMEALAPEAAAEKAE